MFNGYGGPALARFPWQIVHYIPSKAWQYSLSIACHVWARADVPIIIRDTHSVSVFIRWWAHHVLKICPFIHY